MATQTIKRNPGIPLDMGWVRATTVNLSATERRSATLGARRSVKKEWQAAWLLRAITMIDLTTLAGDDTPGKVTRLCAKARQPLRQDLIDALEVGIAEADCGRGLRLSSARPRRDRGFARQRHPGRGGIHWFPRRSQPISHNASKRFISQSRPAPTRSTSSFRASMCCAATGKRFTTRFARCGAPVATPI